MWLHEIRTKNKAAQHITIYCKRDLKKNFNRKYQGPEGTHSPACPFSLSANPLPHQGPGSNQDLRSNQ